MSIIEKLKLKKYDHMTVLNEPSDYSVFKGESTTLQDNHDAIFIFVQTLEEMKQYTDQVIKEKLLRENGYLFFAYPKKGNKRYKTSVHRDEIFPAMEVGEDGYVKNSDLKFSRMVSMDDVFTVVGLKWEKKKAVRSAASSQCVADYENRVEDIIRILNEHPKELLFFQKLTPGYQKDWARYIYSAKQDKTRKKRQAQMVEILGEGFKSMDLYRQGKK